MRDQLRVMLVAMFGPRFAVVVPLHNGKSFIAETLESVLQQTYAPAEIICIDDGSTDGGSEVVKTFGQRIQLITRQNAGVSASRNFGVSLATSERIAFLDQDDLWERENLAFQAKALLAQPEADVCYTGRRLLTYRRDKNDFALGPPSSGPAPDQLAATLFERCPMTPSAVSIRRSTLLSRGGFRSRHDSLEDWDLWLRLLISGAKFTHCPEALMQYRVHPASASHNVIPIFEKSVRIVNEVVAPHMHTAAQRRVVRRVKSRLRSEAAIMLREQSNPGSLEMMLQSLLEDPLHEARRYKIAAHMLLHRRAKR